MKKSIENKPFDWNLVSLIFMISLLVGLYCWNRFSESPNKRNIALGVFLSLSIGYTIFINTGGRPGGIFIVA